MFIVESSGKKRDPRRYEWFKYQGRKATFDVEGDDREQYDLSLVKGDVFGIRRFRNFIYMVEKEDLSLQLKMKEFDGNRILKNAVGWSGKIGAHKVDAGIGGKDVASSVSRKDSKGRMGVKMDSSMFNRAKYDKKQKELYIEFRNGAVWRYKDISAEEALEFENARSQGRWYNENIKGIKEGQRLETF